MKTIEDLWPDDLVNVENPLPKEILIEQANYLRSKTQNILIGEVVTSFKVVYKEKNKVFEHDFILKVPSMGNYQFTLLKVVHGFSIYPLTIYNELDERETTAYSEKEFKYELANILGSSLVRNAIGSLIGRIV